MGHEYDDAYIEGIPPKTRVTLSEPRGQHPFCIINMSHISRKLKPLWSPFQAISNKLKLDSLVPFLMDLVYICQCYSFFLGPSLQPKKLH